MTGTPRKDESLRGSAVHRGASSKGGTPPLSTVRSEQSAQRGGRRPCSYGETVLGRGRPAGKPREGNECGRSGEQGPGRAAPCRLGLASYSVRWGEDTQRHGAREDHVSQPTGPAHNQEVELSLGHDYSLSSPGTKIPEESHRNSAVSPGSSLQNSQSACKPGQWRSPEDPAEAGPPCGLPTPPPTLGAVRPTEGTKGKEEGSTYRRDFPPASPAGSHAPHAPHPNSIPLM